jgi:hypothetical protein
MPTPMKKMPQEYLDGLTTEEAFELSLLLENEGLVYGTPECAMRAKNFHEEVRRRPKDLSITTLA